MKTVNDIRSEFLGFFAGKGHEIVPSSSLVPQNDPTLMFTNSGMVQFKNVFTGAEHRPYTRATTAQKCVRAGGKHNDLENVGYTARHHTFFEMLGNFSFGDYFKDDAIDFAWELVTKNFALNPDKLLVTVHSSDEDAASIWRKVTGFSDDKIIRIPTSANFWQMGDTGPCGPCTEIFYDHGDHIWGGPPGSAEEDGDRFIEIWNLVFMQFEQFADGSRVDLPKPCVDTGMGLERMAATMIGSNTNYDIDLLREIIEKSAALTGVSADGAHTPSHRVIADHLRAASFLIADGVLPSNEGRGYVLRRIMRRGMRHANLLGAREPLMHRLLPILIDKMGEAYPELRRAEALIRETLKGEEERFQKTLERGLKLLEEEKSTLAKGQKFPGAAAFKLYDTFGFPLDLTQDALKAEGIAVDTEGFDACMAEQKRLARAAWKGSGEQATDDLWFEVLDEVGPTEFLGYEMETSQAKLIAFIKDGRRVSNLGQGEEGIIIANQTPFYAESGGQVGDTGRILVELAGVEFEAVVSNTTKALGSLHLHHVNVIKGTAFIREATFIVHPERRQAIRANHSATHLLHEVLRRVLGEHVTQKGSLQDAERTRFDIAHPKGLTAEEIAQVEELVNTEIRADTAVETRVMPLEEARKSGAMALFGEKYDDEVRVVSMGTHAPGESKPYSIELCGGTHVRRTGEIGLLKIISEESLSAGVRRVEALTGAKALAYFAQQESLLSGALSMLKVGKDAFLPMLENKLADIRRLEKEITALRQKMVTGGGSSGGGLSVKEIGGVKFSGQVLDGIPARDLRPMVETLKAQIGSGVVVLITTHEGKASLVVGVTADLTEKLSAVDLVKLGAQALGGSGGGGRPDMAQAGGPDIAAANDALVKIEQSLTA